MSAVASPSLFLGGRVALHAGDCLEVLATLPAASMDSVVTDPPYHLTSIVKRFGEPDAAPAKAGATGAFARASRGFMGQQWDGGDIAFRAELWAEVLRVLKPGGHVVAFSGTRTYHRMACAIEDAGFEIRDSVLDMTEADPVLAGFIESLDAAQLEAFNRVLDIVGFEGLLAWVYGSGFPKSHAVDGGIDDMLFGRWLDADPARRAAYRAEMTGARSLPRAEAQKAAATIDARWRALGGFAPIVLSEGPTVKRMIPGADQHKTGWAKDDGAEYVQRQTRAATPEGRAWEGWGTALKPAWEPIVLARKPLEGTVAETVFAHGTGALNIDRCRIGADGGCRRGGDDIVHGEKANAVLGVGLDLGNAAPRIDGLVRWPANIVHDGSDEVVAGFPNSKGGAGGGQSGKSSVGGVSVYGGGWNDGAGRAARATHDSGSAARFFYSAKADADDRLGSKHPTVKPVDLMRWLVRLVTPPGGTVLDPFAGTGTTGEAAWREGFSAVLIEREAAYRDDIARRMALATEGPMVRRVGAAKAKGAAPALGPLFAPAPSEAEAAP